MATRRGGDSPALRISWPGAEDLQVHPVNQIVVNHDPPSGEFYLTFGLLVPPTVVGEGKDREKAIAEIQARGEVTAQPVVRLMVGPTRMLQFIQILQTNFRQYQENLAGIQAAKEEGTESDD